MSHSGGYPGFGSHMRWHPDSGVGVVLLANSTYAPAAILASQLLAHLLEDVLRGPSRSAAAVAPVSAGRARTRTSARPALPRPPGRTVRPTASTVRPALRPAAASPGVPWPATLAAMTAVEGLLTAWDDAAAHRLLADNVDLDEPLRVRAARARQAAALAGPAGTLDRDPDVPAVHDSPAHALWWLRGPLGRVRLEVRLTPHPEPLVQTLSITPVPHPAEPLAAAIRAVAEQTRTPCPDWPPGVPVAPGHDVDRAVRQLRVAVAYAGPCRVGELLACDGRHSAFVRLVGDRAPLELAIEVDDAGAVRRLTLGHPEQGHASTD